MTASPEQQQLMLYDGTIRFCEQAAEAIKSGDIEQSYTRINKAEQIVMELSNSMKDDVAPETCANMRRLYLFCYDRLVQANLKRDLHPLQEAILVLNELRDTWVMLMEKLKQQHGGSPAETPAEDLRVGEVGATLSVEG